MIFWLLMAMTLLTGTLLQAQLPGMIFLGGIRWPVLAGVVLYYALNHRGAAGAVSAFGAGLLVDTLSLVPLGFSVVLFGVMSWLAGRFRKLVLPEAAVTSTFFGGLAGLLYAVFLYILLVRSGSQYGRLIVIMARIAGSMVAGAVSAPVVFLVLSRLHRSMNLEDKEDDARVNA